MGARYWLEELAGIPCQVEVASEFRYRKVVVQPDTLFVTISQSGETADSLAALRNAKARTEQEGRSEEHTSELQSLMRTSYAVFCLKKKTTQTLSTPIIHTTSTLPTNTSH